MNKRYLLLSIFAFLLSSAFAQTAEEVKSAIVKVNDTWQKGHPGPGYGGSKKGLSAFWDNAVYHTGNMEAYKLFAGNSEAYKLEELGKTNADKAAAKRWLDYATAWAEQNNWMGATEMDSTKWKYQRYGEGNDFVLFGDWQICFQTYLDLYLTDPLVSGNVFNDKRVKRAKEVMDYEVNSGKSDYWWWADALYMVMPVFSKMYKLTQKEEYLDQMYANWQYANSIMYDKETGLYFRDGKYVYPKHTTNAGKKDFWARGDGWVLAAFAKVLQDMPENYKHRKELVKYYKRMAKSVIACQQPEGHWTRSMMDPEQAPGYETSGTALFCYSLFWGINNGYLPKSYTKAAQSAWNYLYTVALQEDGTVGYVQPIGEKAIPGQVVDKKSTSNFGTGAFLLAASEYVRFLEK